MALRLTYSLFSQVEKKVAGIWARTLCLIQVDAIIYWSRVECLDLLFMGWWRRNVCFVKPWQLEWKQQDVKMIRNRSARSSFSGVGSKMAAGGPESWCSPELVTWSSRLSCRSYVQKWQSQLLRGETKSCWFVVLWSNFNADLTLKATV